jgi:hypothetical protein
MRNNDLTRLKNLLSFIEYRKYTISATSHETKFDLHGYYRIECEKDKTVLYLLSDQEPIATSTPKHFENMLKTIPPGFTGIFFFGEQLRSKKKTLFYSTPNVFEYSHTHLCTNIPKGTMCPVNIRILSNDEIQEYKKMFDPNDLPVVFLTDPQMIWLGAKEKDIVSVQYLQSDCSGIPVQLFMVEDNRDITPSCSNKTFNTSMSSSSVPILSNAVSTAMNMIKKKKKSIEEITSIAQTNAIVSPSSDRQQLHGDVRDVIAEEMDDEDEDTGDDSESSSSEEEVEIDAEDDEFI